MKGQTERKDRTLGPGPRHPQRPPHGEPAFLYPSEQLFGETGMLMDYYDVCAGSIVTEKGVDQQALEGYFADMLRIQQAERENTPELGDGVSFATMVTFSGGGSGAEVLDPGSNRLSEGKALFHVQELAGQFSLENILTALNGREGGRRWCRIVRAAPAGIQGKSPHGTGPWTPCSAVTPIRPPAAWGSCPPETRLSLYLPTVTAGNAGVSLAASVVMLLPALLIFLFGQKYLEQGIAAAGLKD